jgi:hypothetical protein
VVEVRTWELWRCPVCGLMDSAGDDVEIGGVSECAGILALETNHEPCARERVQVVPKEDVLKTLAPLDRARTALRWLVMLKEGPRDAAYEHDKPRAWAAAQAALGGEHGPDTNH